MEKLNLNKEELSIITDPFKKSCITKVRMVMSENLFSPGFSFKAYIDFKNGNTTGKQTLSAESFDALYIKTSEFLKTL